MIIVTDYFKECKDGTIRIHSREESICPVCGGPLKVHGTCRRRAWILDEDLDDAIKQVEYILRVLECTNCGKTHREIPDTLVPYKRYSLSLICQEAEDPDYVCETSTMLRLRWWIAWFLAYAAEIARRLALLGVYSVTNPIGGSLAERMKFFVRLVVNSGFWIQHRSAVTARR